LPSPCLPERQVFQKYVEIVGQYDNTPAPSASGDLPALDRSTCCEFCTVDDPGNLGNI
jgi:hypothetical protein